MSAAAESTMSGGNAVPGNESTLEQPNDAMPMKNITQSPEMDQNPAVEPAKDASEPSSSSEPPAVVTEAAVSEPADHGETSVTASPKGKQKEDTPEPLATEEVATDVKPKVDDKSTEEISKEGSSMAIGPAQDDIKHAGSGKSDGPVCNITLLLASGGRHPYRIDGKYLSRRNVAMPDEDDNGNPDPFSISIYTLKELILREWRSDWEAKPASPSSIRLIHFGKLLDDKEQLKKYQFSNESPNVVHMSIRPQDLDEEEPKGGNKNLPAGGGDGDGAREGRCCVIL